MGDIGRTHGGGAPSWARLADEALLDVRLCDLGLDLDRSPVAARMRALGRELEGHGLCFRTYAWFSTDWFTPDDCTGFAVPFYLAHPRLAALERRQMLEVEGGSSDACMRLLRHEAAHALDNAYDLHQRRDWRAVFGRFSEPYRSTYSPDPSSRDHVQNLPYWYAQSHPAEDWAETFAVWLATSPARWRARYAGWSALRKLEFVDGLMTELGAQPPRHRSRRREEPLSQVRQTLRTYYRRKRATYAEDTAPAFDGQLTRLFEPGRRGDGRTRAATFLQRRRRRLAQHVARTTGQMAYVVDHVIAQTVQRCRNLDLCLRGDEAEALLESAILITSLSSQFLFGGHPRYTR